MSVIFCGIPRDEDGQYRCPHCGYRSADLESFATSMCWTCVFAPEDANPEPPDLDDYEDEADQHLGNDDPPPWWES